MFKLYLDLVHSCDAIWKCREWKMITKLMWYFYIYSYKITYALSIKLYFFFAITNNIFIRNIITTFLIQLSNCFEFINIFQHPAYQEISFHSKHIHFRKYCMKLLVRTNLVYMNFYRICASHYWRLISKVSQNKWKN